MSATRSRADSSWLNGQQFEPVRWVVPGIIPEGQTLLVAPPKAGKSWLSYAIAIARASAGVVLGQRVKRGPVLYLALEDGWRRLKNRAEQLLAPGEPIPDGIEYVIRVNPSESVIELIRTWVGEHHGQNPLVIIDTFGRIKPPARAGVGAYEHDYAVMAALKSLVDDEPGSAMILVHHDRKAASDDFMDNVSGTNGLAGAADTTVVIARPRTGTDAVLSVTGRDVTEAEYAVTFSAGKWELAGGSLAEAKSAVATQRTAAKAAAKLGSRANEVLSVVNRHPEGMRAKDVAAELKDLPEDQAKVYLARLEKAAYVDRPTRGIYTPVTSVTSVTTDRGDAGESRANGVEVTEGTVVTRPPARSGAPTCSGHGEPLGATGKCLACISERAEAVAAAKAEARRIAKAGNR